MTQCPQCETKVNKTDKFCPGCGFSLEEAEPTIVLEETCNKSRLAAALLAIFLGSLGIHNFYLGFTTRALVQLLVSTIGGLLTCGISTAAIQIWAFVEGILILIKSPGYQKDAAGNLLND